MMWTSDTASTMCLSQIKVLFLLKIMPKLFMMNLYVIFEVATCHYPEGGSFKVSKFYL